MKTLILVSYFRGGGSKIPKKVVSSYVDGPYELNQVRIFPGAIFIWGAMLIRKSRVFIFQVRRLSRDIYPLKINFVRITYKTNLLYIAKSCTLSLLIQGPAFMLAWLQCVDTRSYMLYDS